ncbi:MAG: aminotransferase class III-fold pyridoxal phosphate-dependent enzyme, partial [Chryseobacterium sp.]|nr:aminotransferase class III-fold pyridoxal phosphate-dependent enzyme [Chryseobacterium sp.]
ILEVIEKENLVENARNMGVFLLNGLIKIEQKFPNLISNARGRGLMCAFDLPTPELRNALQAELYNNHLIILTCGTQSIRFRPHLNVTKVDLEKALDIIDKVLTEM